MSDEVISVEHVSFSYSRSPFIRDISFAVGKGEVFGFLGPSGAGKSTLQKILIGLIQSFSGNVRVAGCNPQKPGSLYERIGVDFEFPSIYEKLTARENLRFFASLYPQKKNVDSKERINELLELAGLAADADKRAGEFSKGMKSRLNFIKALVHDPDVLFLDEPTSGLDPANASRMKAHIQSLSRQGKTIILTTHNMYDAAELCSRVAFIVDGQIKALDTPHNLIMRRGGNTVQYTWQEQADGANGQMVEKSSACGLHSLSSDAQLLSLIAENRITSIHSSEPTLNDIFVEVTGRTLV